MILSKCGVPKVFKCYHMNFLEELNWQLDFLCTNSIHSVLLLNAFLYQHPIMIGFFKGLEFALVESPGSPSPSGG